MFKNLTRVLALALAVAMMLTMVSCDWFKKDPRDGWCEAGTHVDANGDGVCDVEDCSMALSYTYNTYLTVFPNTWNSHTYQTATDSEILDYTTVGFYTFDYNETKDGFVIVPEMAAKMPVDVSEDYVGEEWGISEGETSRAWLIELRDDLAWEDGTPIKANDFVESAKRLLDPKALNYRADSLYSGNLVVSNAKGYFYSGRYVKNYTPMIEVGYVPVSDLTVGENGQYKTESGSLWFNIKDGNQWSSNSLYDYAAAGYLTIYETDEEGNTVMDAEGNPVVAVDALPTFKEIMAKADEENYVAVDAEVAEGLMFCVAVLHGFPSADAYQAAMDAADPDHAKYPADYAYTEWEEFIYYDGNYPVITYDKVGIKAVSDTEIVIILEKALDGFYLNYSLGTDLGLVHIPTYDACASVDENGLYSNTYGTSVDTYKSFGPYKLTEYQMDKKIVLERNTHWYGYSDSARANQFQTTKVVYDKYENDDTAMTAFLQGKLDSKGLDVKYIADYTSSDRIYYTDGASTWFIALNPNEEAFADWESKNEGYDKSILTMKEFRMALSFSLNRQDFINALDPMGSIGLALFNNMICSDPENGTMYRTEEAAKDVILEFWGVSQDDIGPGKLYPTKDEAIASITGYNLAGAKALFDEAYDAAVEAGLYNGTDKILINIGTPNSTSNFYNNGYEFLKNNYTEAVKGTKLEGKLEFTNTNTLGNGFADALRANTVDMLFGVGWTGSALNPYGLIGAYTQPSYQYDPSWNTSTSMMQFVIDGVTYEASVLDWTSAIEGDKVKITNVETEAEVDYSCGTSDIKTNPERQAERLRLLGALEGAVLRNYDMIPTHNQASASLLGKQVEYYTQEYVYGVGRGGIQYMTYNYTDAEWDAYVSDNNGTINYK